MPFCVPLAEMLGVVPGKPKVIAVWLESVVASLALVMGKALSVS